MEVSPSLILSFRTRATEARTTRTHTSAATSAQVVSAGLLMVIAGDERMEKLLLESCSEAIEHHNKAWRINTTNGLSVELTKLRHAFRNQVGSKGIHPHEDMSYLVCATVLATRHEIPLSWMVSMT